MSKEDDIYVKKDEFHKKIGHVYKKINDNERENSEALNDLKVNFEGYRVLQKQMYQAQQETNTNIKDLTQVMKDVGAEMTDVKYRVKAHDENIQSIQGAIDAKQKAGVQVVAAVIGAAGVIIAAAFGFAQIFF